MQLENSLAFSVVCVIVSIVFILSTDGEARSDPILFVMFDNFPGRLQEFSSRGPRPMQHNCRCIDAVNLRLVNEGSHNVHCTVICHNIAWQRHTTNRR